MRIATALLLAAMSAATLQAGHHVHDLTPTESQIHAVHDLTPTVSKVLESIRAADKGQLAVSEEDGRFLRVLIASTGARHVLEIGAASGYSAIWMGLG